MRHIILEYCFSGARQGEGNEEERGGMDKFIKVVCLFFFFFGTFQVHLFVLTVKAHFFSR